MSSKETRDDATVLEAIPYPPGSKLPIQLESLTRLSKSDLSASLDRLYAADLIGECNGWLFRLGPVSKDPLSRDDVEWLTGTGRFGQ